MKKGHKWTCEHTRQWLTPRKTKSYRKRYNNSILPGSTLNNSFHCYNKEDPKWAITKTHDKTMLDGWGEKEEGSKRVNITIDDA